MDLSTEDTLKLNVLLASRPLAVRIDESAMTVHGLSSQGETRVALNPNCRDDLYIRRVKELISGHVLGSPGGYPIYLRRWTRMGQTRDESLAQLLLLGEPEAVVAVVHAPGLTHEFARRAWWAMPTAENARRMLERDVVVQSPLGPELAAYLLEYLPFETEPADMIDTVRLVLQPGLIDEKTRLSLWQRSRQKTAFIVGFLLGAPHDLPEPVAERADRGLHGPALEALAGQGNPVAGLLLRVLGAAGQSYLQACLQVMKKPPNQDVVNLFLDAVAWYFGALRPAGEVEGDLEVFQARAAELVGEPGADPHLAAVLERVPALRDDLQAALVLGRLGYPVVRPVFSRTTAIGSLMRRKLEPVFAPLAREFEQLMRPNGS
ncbi:MAG: sulfur reduction protein DsrS [Gammaproteobacteria bacterium]|nr:sulfur reduction protein DsrS [Gammaproteobacteria bacterium]